MVLLGLIAVDIQQHIWTPPFIFWQHILYPSGNNTPAHFTTPLIVSGGQQHTPGYFTSVDFVQSAFSIWVGLAAYFPFGTDTT